MNDNLIYPSCPLCGTEEGFIYKLSIGDLKIVACPEDGLLMFRPNTSKKDHFSFVDENYFVYSAFQNAKTAGGYNFDSYLKLLNQNLPIKGYPDYLEPEHLKAKISWGRRCLSWFIQYAGKQKLKTVVDIGCSTGHFLQDFIRMGKFEKAVGIDLSPWAIEQGKELLKRFINSNQLDLFAGECWEYKTDYIFDCVILWDSFEHIQLPIKALEWIKEYTSPQAMVVVHTPDADCAGDASWYLWSPKQHCFFYSAKTLDMLFAKYDFKFIAKKVSPEADEMIRIYQKEESK